MVPPGALTEDEYLLVAAVAEREAWLDLRDPPVDGGMRTLAEHEAVVRYANALPLRSTRRRARDERRAATAAMVVLGALGLGACWAVSPQRTVAAMVLVGFTGLLAMQRRAGRANRRVGSLR